MENIGIWIMAAIAWILFIVSFLIPGIDWSLIIFLVLSIIAFTLVADWLISDTRTKKKQSDRLNKRVSAYLGELREQRCSTEETIASLRYGP
ncbi:MAG: popeye domain-containing protein [Candidatus Bathyarchaeota archaeon]|nr:popeye domain-containing protein [Candidatus Bathyarchaeota archaeon]